MRNDLLPCPFCGSLDLDVKSGTEDREGIPVSIYCQSCGCVGPWIYAKDRIANDLVVSEWNTRTMNDHIVTFKREKPGVVSHNAVWIVFSGCYMYGPCENWQDVENQIRSEWEHDRHLVG